MDSASSVDRFEEAGRLILLRPGVILDIQRPGGVMRNAVPLPYPQICAAFGDNLVDLLRAATFPTVMVGMPASFRIRSLKGV